MILLPDSENRMIVASFISTQYHNVTEGQTDRQTAGWTETAISNTVVTLQATSFSLNYQCLVLLSQHQTNNVTSEQSEDHRDNHHMLRAESSNETRA